MLGLLPNMLQAAQRGDLPIGLDHAIAVQWGVVIGASLAAALWDLRTRRIPNGLTGPLWLTGIAWQSWLGGMPGVLDGLLGCLVAAVPFVILFLYAGGGAGDAKMMGALGAWLGLAQGLVVLVAVVCAGAVIGLGYAMVKKRLFDVLGRVTVIAMTATNRLKTGTLRDGAEKEKRSEDELLEMPYALSILCGVCIAAIGAMSWHV